MNFNTEMKRVSELDEESALSYDEQPSETEEDVSKRKKLIFGVILLTFAALIAVIVLAVIVGNANDDDDDIILNTDDSDSSQGAQTSTPLIVNVSGIGTIQGRYFQNDSVVGFLGIPYAESTAPPNRWKPPVPKQWPSPSGVVNAEDFGADCVGEFTDDEASEDCLFVNIFRPAVMSNQSKPVLVWIHGGALEYGAGNNYAIDRLVERGTRQEGKEPVIVITINYRLGVFGWLYSDELIRPGSTVGGNFGLLDQLQALKWIHSNIAAFGGDPSKITVMGQSAAATTVTVLQLLDETYSYISGAGMMSGANLNHFFTAEEGENIYANLTAECGCANLTCFESLEPDELKGCAYFGPKPVLDGILLPTTYSDANDIFAENADKYRIPLLLGVTRDELTHEEWNTSTFESTLRGWVDFPAANSDYWLDQILTGYNASYPDDEEDRGNYTIAWWQSAWALSDYTFTAPTRRVAATAEASATTNRRAPLRYTYMFAVPTKTVTPIEGSGPGAVIVPHSSDLPYLWVCSDYKGVDRNDSACAWENEADRKLAEDWSGWWLDFARGGELSSPWMPFQSNEGRTLLVLPNNIYRSVDRTHPALRGEQCDTWDEMENIIHNLTST